MNDMYAQQKLNNNLQILAQCEQIAAGQSQAVRNVLGYIQSTVTSLQAECARLQNSIQAERIVIFENVSHDELLGMKTRPFTNLNWLPDKASGFSATGS
jgi:hypothetical protein